MHRKYLALIIVMLFALTMFNSTIVAEKDDNRMTLLKVFLNGKEKFDTSDAENNLDVEDYDEYLDLIGSDVLADKEKFQDLDNSVVLDCIKNEDYSKLLKFMGNGSKLVKNVHVNASGLGLYTVKKIRLLAWASPLPRLTRLGFFQPGLINAWLFYIKLNNRSYVPNKSDEKVYSNATTLIEPENGDDPITIYGNHSILALVWQMAPVNKIWGLKRKLINWYNMINGLGKKSDPPKVNATFPWSFEKWRFKNFWNYVTVPPNLMFLTTQELIFMITGWPFNFWMSFLNFFWPSSIMGMAAFVIYNDSEADS